MEGDDKSIVLLYHVYHAKQATTIHDWERIESIVVLAPGSGSGSGSGP